MKHNQIALEIARQGIVLLKNDGALPIATDRPLKIAVIGGYAPAALDRAARHHAWLWRASGRSAARK